jgi:signal transduction histidine kinase
MQARRSEIDFQVLYPPLLDCAHLNIDVNKCGQVLRNLVSNALKFTPAGGTVKLVCTLLTSLGEPLTVIDDSLADQDAVHFRFEVHDTGPGISAVSASELFFSHFCASLAILALMVTMFSGKPTKAVQDHCSI